MVRRPSRNALRKKVAADAEFGLIDWPDSFTLALCNAVRAAVQERKKLWRPHFAGDMTGKGEPVFSTASSSCVTKSSVKPPPA